MNGDLLYSLLLEAYLFKGYGDGPLRQPAVKIILDNWKREQKEMADKELDPYYHYENDLPVGTNYGRGKWCYDCNFGHAPGECQMNPGNKEDASMEWKNPDMKEPEKKTFTKGLVKWGLLRRVALDGKPWSLCIFANSIFDTLEDAYAQANEYNTADGEPAYLYRPVELLVTAKVDAND